MLGLMTLVWAWAESTLAMTIGIIIENAGPIRGHSEAPLSFKNRVGCFKAALRDVVALEPLQKEGRALTVRFIALGARRNDLIHGAAWQLKEGGFEAMALVVGGGNYIVKNHRFNVGDTVLLNAEIAKLQDDAAAFMLRVVGIFQK